MKATKLLILLTVLTLSFNRLKGQTDEKSILMISFYESTLDNNEWCKAIVTENDKKLEEFKLSPFRLKELGENQIEKNKILSKYRKLGYNLVSESKVGSISKDSYQIIISSYTFEK